MQMLALRTASTGREHHEAGRALPREGGAPVTLDRVVDAIEGAGVRDALSVSLDHASGAVRVELEAVSGPAGRDRASRALGAALIGGLGVPRLRIEFVPAGEPCLLGADGTRILPLP